MKELRTRNDLALYGAPPAFAELLHVGRPNMGDENAFLERARGIYASKWLTNNGPVVQELEATVATMHDVQHCVAMCNGTVALEIAIRALGLSGEVIIPSYTFVATAHALYWQGITPVFADIDPTTHNLDPDAVRALVTPRTTGIIGVHLWGRPAPVEALQAIADDHGLQLMFDAAHAFACSHGGQKIGCFGRCEVLSFHATKVFNTFEGGAVLTNDDALAERMRLMRNFGFAGFDNVVHPGTNGKMPEICAAMGLVNIAALPSFVESNRERHRAYRRELEEVAGIHLLAYDEADEPNYQYVVIELERDFPAGRDEVIAALQAENILARKYFWPGCHRMQPYRDIYPQASLHLGATEEVAARVVVLPTGATLPEAAVPTVGAVLSILGSTGGA